MMLECSLLNESKLVFQSTGPKSHFFGYYDKSPWNSTGDKILCHRTEHKLGLIEEEDIVEVGFFSLNDNEFHKIGVTNSCNWQQGSMLQWLPCDYNSKIIYNKKISGSIRTVVYNLSLNKTHVINRPVYTIHPSGKNALGLNMERLYFMRRAYAYPGFVNSKWGAELVPDDGIYFIDLKKNKSRVIIRVSDIANHDPKQIMKGAYHWLDHPMINPNGSRFLFYHRWTNKSRGFFSRLYSADLDGGNLHMFPDSGMYSHANWINDNELCVFGRTGGTDVRTSEKQSFTKYVISILTPLYYLGKRFSIVRRIKDRILRDHFLHFRDGDNNFSIIGKDLIETDGHPSINPIYRHLLLTDTYPDYYHNRHLLIFNMPQNTLFRVGKFKSLKGHTASTDDRCDLHPRWNRNGNCVCIDSTHEGMRQIYVIQIPNKILENSSL